eukprot:14091655-Alexandrium_andersonii.AAC.1
MRSLNADLKGTYLRREALYEAEDAAKEAVGADANEAEANGEDEEAPTASGQSDLPLCRNH